MSAANIIGVFLIFFLAWIFGSQDHWCLFHLYIGEVYVMSMPD